MRARLTSFAIGALGCLLVLALYAGVVWTRARYAEFLIMRLVVINSVCQSNPAEAATIGITCASPAAPSPVATGPPAR